MLPRKSHITAGRTLCESDHFIGITVSFSNELFKKLSLSASYKSCFLNQARKIVQ